MILRALKRILRFLAALYVGAAIVAWVVDPEPLPDHPFFDTGDAPVLAIAHRGGPSLGPESTMPVYEKVADMGIDVLEMDVHVTADGRLIVAHDRRVDRVTNGSGRIRDMTFDEIRALDAAWHWSPDGGETFPMRGQGIQMPTVEEMFERFGDFRFVIELKSSAPETARGLCGAIRDHAMGDRVSVASFSDDAIEAFREACPGVITASAMKEGMLFWVLHRLRLDDLYAPVPFAAFQTSIRMFGFEMVTERMVASARRRNIAIQVWTIDDRDEMEWLIDLGVNGIMTDQPERLLSLLKEYDPQ